jgi:hypothetical protein
MWVRLPAYCFEINGFSSSLSKLPDAAHWTSFLKQVLQIQIGIILPDTNAKHFAQK